MNGVPRKEDMYNPLLQALRELGGSGTIDEIAERVITALKVPEDVASRLHDPESSNETELEYRLAWARTYLKNYGILERSGRGVWALKADGRPIERVDPVEVNRYVQSLNRQKPHGSLKPVEDEEAAVQVQDPEAPDAIWRQTLYRVLTTVLTPAAFERLTMRLLRESGFVHAEVTGRTGDGGIDGKGIARMAGVLVSMWSSSASGTKEPSPRAKSVTSEAQWSGGRTKGCSLRQAGLAETLPRKPLGRGAANRFDRRRSVS